MRNAVMRERALMKTDVDALAKSWYLVAKDDKMIPPPAQRQMSRRAGSDVVEVAGSHAVFMSQPQSVAALIEKAANSVTAKAK